MKHIVSGGNWHMQLADVIESAQDGDTIAVPSEAVAELGEMARERMCPNKELTFIVEGEE